MREITLNVPQGIGDVFWCYQKFSPFFDKINWNVCVISNSVGMNVQQRTAGWTDLLPKSGDTNFITVSDKRYHDVAQLHYHAADIIKKPMPGPFDFSCNKLLEEGVRLEAIDPGLPLELDVPVRDAYAPLPYIDYIVLYVSGCRHPHVWQPHQWIDLVRNIYQRYKWSFPIVLIGANYDRENVADIDKRLTNAGFPHVMYIDSYPANVTYIIKNARFFIGFQSGLSILADNYNVPQLMMYLEILKPVLWAWPKKQNIERGVYNASLFSKSPTEVANSLNTIDIKASGHKQGVITGKYDEFVSMLRTMTADEKKAIHTLCYATPDYHQVFELVNSKKPFPNLKYQISILNRFPDSAIRCLADLKKHRLDVTTVNLEQMEDLSLIGRKRPETILPS